MAVCKGLCKATAGADRASRLELVCRPFFSSAKLGIAACSFVAASMRVLGGFVAMWAGSRRILHTNVTARPTAEWSLQQFRECL